MNGPVTIRHGVPGSLRAQAAALYCEALEAKLTPFLGAARFLDPAMRTDRAFVATDGAGILGIAGFEENRAGLFDIGLAPLERREEPGTLLMDGIAVAAVCEHARSLGRTGVRLDVVDTNPRARASSPAERSGSAPCARSFPSAA